MNRCSKKECCKQCSHVNFKGTVTKWPVQKTLNNTKTRRTTRPNRPLENVKISTIYT